MRIGVGGGAGSAALAGRRGVGRWVGVNPGLGCTFWADGGLKIVRTSSPRLAHLHGSQQANLEGILVSSRYQALH